jgi:signal transduction histidine kinase/HAMP domain-containing protein
MQAVERAVHPADEITIILGALNALKRGDASVRLPMDWPGALGRVADVFNDVVDRNERMAQELERLSRMVGKEGKLAKRGSLGDVTGFWRDSIDAVNQLIDDLVHPTSETARVIGAVAQGDLSQTMALEADGQPLQGEFLRTAKTVNKMVDQLGAVAEEVTRVAREVGTEGKLGGQARVKGVAGTWKDLTDSVNSMAGNLTAQMRNIADVTTAVATGDLSKKITVDVKGEILELKDTINTMVDQLRSFASEVTRVAREVGTDGRLGGQADVQGVAGTWKDLTESVNSMASNLTAQVRNIADVTKAVASGDLSKKITVDVKGEILELKNTINTMVDQLSSFAAEVTRVAREVGVEGMLGGQARVPGVAGTWKGLTENVNQLAANLTTQVRAIAEVATAVTQGDLTRSITVDARGEVAALKDTANEMIRNLRDTTRKNTEQDWLKTNLAKFSRMLQGHKDLHTVCRLILTELAPVVSAQHGLFYVLDSGRGQPRLTLLASYGFLGESALGSSLELGEGLVGQCAVDQAKIHLSNVPLDYLKISSGLGSAPPQNIIVLPVIFEGRVKGVLELASFAQFSATHEAFLDQLTESIGIVINTIEANTRTEDLLTQSQSLAHELQSRQQELQQTNQELEEKAGLLAFQKQEVERKNQEVEQARKALEEKAEQLALTSKYKSEFLANMSHELRTPLNSLLILSDQLSKNSGGNLTDKQVEFAKTIHASGNDLLTLINDILDLSKIESGTVVVDPADLLLGDLQRYVERTFRHVAEAKNVDFFIRMDPRLPSSMLADAKRLQQVLKNLLSNAFKFTHRGHVTLTVETATSGWDPANESLSRAGDVIAFSVTDTGIGISPDKQRIIFEAFQQADGGTSRKYGGTGLGLAHQSKLATEHARR